jgi:hypothetical protein
VKWRDVELPNFRHGFESFAAERIRVGGDAAPAEDAEALGVGCGFDCGFGINGGGSGKKGEAEAEDLGEVNALLLRAGAEKIVRERGEEACAVAAGSVGIDAAAVGEAFEGGQGNVDDFMAGGLAEARNETGATSVVVWVAPIWVPIAAGWHAPLVHICLLSREG